jgi:hypothetical protein
LFQGVPFRHRKGRESRHASYAGINQIRFLGYVLSPQAPPVTLKG